MKKILFVIAIFLIVPIFSKAQSDYRVVFDVTSKDSMVHRAVIRWINEILGPNADAKIEVVFYAQSLEMVTKGKSTVNSEIVRLVQNKNISFKVCAIAMKNRNLQKSDLIPGVETVPDGIYEIISRQRSGWGYIKAGL